MSRRAMGVWLGIGVSFAAGIVPTTASAQKAQAKTHSAGKPSGFVTLLASAAPGELVEAEVVTPEGGAGTPFVLPPGTVLVVTDFQAEGTGTLGPRYVSACTGGNCVNAVLRLAFDTNDDLSRSLSLTSGVVFREPPQVSCAGASADFCSARLYGYLAKDK